MKAMQKKGALNIGSMISGVITLIIGIIIIFQVLSGTASDLYNAGENVSATSLPLATLFDGSGVLLLIFMAGILITVASLAMKRHG